MLLIPDIQELKGRRRTKGLFQAMSHMAVHSVTTRGTVRLFAFPLPFPVMLSPGAVFASLLSCHATVLSFLIPVKESALLRFPQEMEQT